MQVLHTHEIKQISGGKEATFNELFFSVSCGFAYTTLFSWMHKDIPVIANDRFITSVSFYMGYLFGRIICEAYGDLAETNAPSNATPS